MGRDSIFVVKEATKEDSPIFNKRQRDFWRNRKEEWRKNRKKEKMAKRTAKLLCVKSDSIFNPH